MSRRAATIPALKAFPAFYNGQSVLLRAELRIDGQRGVAGLGRRHDSRLHPQRRQRLGRARGARRGVGHRPHGAERPAPLGQGSAQPAGRGADAELAASGRTGRGQRHLGGLRRSAHRAQPAKHRARPRALRRPARDHPGPVPRAQSVWRSAPGAPGRRRTQGVRAAIGRRGAVDHRQGARRGAASPSTSPRGSTRDGGWK